MAQIINDIEEKLIQLNNNMFFNPKHKILYIVQITIHDDDNEDEDDFFDDDKDYIESIDLPIGEVYDPYNKEGNWCDYYEILGVIVCEPTTETLMKWLNK